MPKYVLSQNNPRRLSTSMKVSKQLLELIESKRNPREPLGETLWRLLNERDFLRKKVQGLELEVQDLKEALDLERVIKVVRNKGIVMQIER